MMHLNMLPHDRRAGRSTQAATNVAGLTNNSRIPGFLRKVDTSQHFRFHAAGGPPLAQAPHRTGVSKQLFERSVCRDGSG